MGAPYNHDRTARDKSRADFTFAIIALDLLRQGPGPYVEREFVSRYGQEDALARGASLFADDCFTGSKLMPEWVIAPILKVAQNPWNEVCGRAPGRVDQPLVQ